MAEFFEELLRSNFRCGRRPRSRMNEPAGRGLVPRGGRADFVIQEQ